MSLVFNANQMVSPCNLAYFSQHASSVNAYQSFESQVRSETHVLNEATIQETSYYYAFLENKNGL